MFSGLFYHLNNIMAIIEIISISMMQYRKPSFLVIGITTFLIKTSDIYNISYINYTTS